MHAFNKILISGASGFIGSHLVRRLIEDGFEVGIIKRDNSDIWRIKDIKNCIAVYETDLRDINGVSKSFSHFVPDAIFHLATYYAIEHKIEEIARMVDTNVLGTINLLEASKEHNVKLFANTSSCFVYKESANPVKESDPLKPLNLYAMTKLQAEQACSFYAEEYGLKSVTFRLFPPYGPADHDRRLIPHVIRSIMKGDSLKLTTGRQKWDFVYIEDIIDAYVQLLYNKNFLFGHEIFNIGTGNSVAVRDVVIRINEVTGGKAQLFWGSYPHRNNEVWSMRADISKAKSLLGWQPKTQILDDGLELTIKWYKYSVSEGANGSENN